MERFGRLDAAFAVAGGATFGTIVDGEDADWDGTVALVLRGVYLTVRHTARAMRSGGRGGAIVAVASLNAHVPMWGGSAYSAGKAGRREPGAQPGLPGSAGGAIMKVPVATAHTQGVRPNDYHWAVEGELVRIDSVCRKDLDDPEGDCGCGRGFAGTNSARATTTALVAEVPLSLDDYAEAIRSSLEQQGYGTRTAWAEAEGLADCAAAFATGTVLERRIWDLRVRALPLDGAA